MSKPTPAAGEPDELERMLRDTAALRRRGDDLTRRGIELSKRVDELQKRTDAAARRTGDPGNPSAS